MSENAGFGNMLPFCKLCDKFVTFPHACNQMQSTDTRTDNKARSTALESLGEALITNEPMKCALKWLDDNFGLHENHVAGNALKMVRGTDGVTRAIFIKDKDGNLWRFSEVLAAYAAYAISIQRGGAL